MMKSKWLILILGLLALGPARAGSQLFISTFTAVDLYQLNGVFLRSIATDATKPNYFDLSVQGKTMWVYAQARDVLMRFDTETGERLFTSRKISEDRLPGSALQACDPKGLDDDHFIRLQEKTLIVKDGIPYLGFGKFGCVVRYNPDQDTFETLLPIEKNPIDSYGIVSMAYGPNGHWFMLSRGDYTVREFDDDGKEILRQDINREGQPYMGPVLDKWYPSEAEMLIRPEDMVFGPDNKLYIISVGTVAGYEQGPAVVKRYDVLSNPDKEAVFEGDFTHGFALRYPKRMAFGPAPDYDLFIYDQGKQNIPDRIVRYDGRTGEYTKTIRTKLQLPNNIFIDNGESP
jgi:hypothetical protein